MDLGIDIHYVAIPVGFRPTNSVEFTSTNTVEQQKASGQSQDFYFSSPVETLLVSQFSRATRKSQKTQLKCKQETMVSLGHIMIFLSTVAVVVYISRTIDAKTEELDLSPPFFGAKPPSKGPYPMHRRGWEECNQCGGAERLGAIVDVGNVNGLTTEGIEEILDAVRAHGVIIIKKQNMTRSQQVAFTDLLGEVVVLPSSFEGKDPEPFEPAIQRITNFWANGTWKGNSSQGFGSYWHQDGQFWLRPKHNVLSILHAQSTPPSGGETGFADIRAARATLSQPLLERAKDAYIQVSVHDIADFARGTEEDLAAFPVSEHPILDHHAVDGGPMLYVGSPHMKVGGLESPQAGKVLINMLLLHATSPVHTYFHAWDKGDIIIWDNTQTLHKAMPYKNDGTAVRELYRTQARLPLDDDGMAPVAEL
eukprot:scaffold310_cov168-Amphora_coffeaeformis.AAC.36